MIPLLYISILWLLFTGFTLIRNQFEFTKLKRIKPSLKAFPKVSICIPARNEEKVIENCVQSVLEQQYLDFELLVLDDQSEDATGEILAALSAKDSRLRVLEGETKPDDWLGKPHACQQLGKQAEGDLLFFIDADTWWEAGTLEKLVTAMQEHKLDAITVWPQQHLASFWEQTILPLVYYALNTLLAASSVHKAPVWIPPFIRKKVAHHFAAANGQCIGFSKESYSAIGGHQAVKNEVVEDVELARTLIRSGFSIRMFNGVEQVHCRMYSSLSEIWQGFRKNFLAGFGNNLLLFFFAWLMHIIVFLLPTVTLFVGLIEGNEDYIMLSLISIALIIAQRIILSFQFKWNPWYSLTHMFGVIWFQFLAFQCLADYFSGNRGSWKGRPV
jgi:chlorobactene glucosyltransferase